MSNLSTINVRVRLTLCLKRKDIMEKENQNVETENTESTENVDTQTTEEKEAKTFKELLESNKSFQEEFNTIIQDRLKKAKKDMPSKEDLKAFNDWKESQKTEVEKQAEVLKENETLKNRVLELENMQVVANAGVDTKFQKFVLSEVSKDGDFEDNLKDYLKENPQYLQTTTSTPQNTGVAVNKINNSEEDGVMAILKSKHPEAF